MLVEAGSVRLAHAQLAVGIAVASRVALPGQTIPLPVFLDTAGFDLSGLINDIELDTGIHIPPMDVTQRVECRMTQLLPGEESGFGRVPLSCMPDRNCIGVRAFILALGGGFENGELYRCNVAVARDARPGTYRLRCTNAGTATLGAEDLPTVCSDGEIRVTDRAGDCDGDGLVTIDELVRGVAVTMGELALEECAPLDGDLDGRARVNDVVRAVASALG